MAVKKYESYCAGQYDVLRVFGQEQLQSESFEYPDDDKGEFDLVEYMRGQIAGLTDVIKALHDVRADR